MIRKWNGKEWSGEQIHDARYEALKNENEMLKKEIESMKRVFDLDEIWDIERLVNINSQGAHYSESAKYQRILDKMRRLV